MALERGFKSWAERTSTSFRADLGLDASAPLGPAQLARHLDIDLATPSDIQGLPAEALDQLLRRDPSGWSAVSVFRGERGLVIYNPIHSLGRQASDIMHELAHFILDHAPGSVILSPDGALAMRSYDAKQEEEANWLAWCLLLPRDALLRCARLRLRPEEIAREYGVTATLANFRRRITGVDAQLRARRRL